MLIRCRIGLYNGSDNVCIHYTYYTCTCKKPRGPVAGHAHKVISRGARNDGNLE